MELEPRRTAFGTAACGDAERLLRASFPEGELLSAPVMYLATRRRCVDFLSWYVSGRFAALSCSAAAEKMAFILYLAVCPEMRSRGVGGAVLSALLSRFGSLPVGLNVEPTEPGAPNLDERVRRIDFYRRHGFFDIGRFAVDGRERYLILATCVDFSPREYRRAMSRMTFGLHAPRIV